MHLTAERWHSGGAARGVDDLDACHRPATRPQEPVNGGVLVAVPIGEERRVPQIDRLARRPDRLLPKSRPEALLVGPGLVRQPG